MDDSIVILVANDGMGTADLELQHKLIKRSPSDCLPHLPGLLWIAGEGSGRYHRRYDRYS